MRKIKRYVTGLNEAGQSFILFDDYATSTFPLGSGGLTDVWATAEVPVNNKGETDRSLRPMQQVPAPHGTIFRVVEIPPDKELAEAYAAAHAGLQSEHKPTESDQAKHASMHKEDTLTYAAIIEGEVWFMTDTDEVLLKPGDCLVCRGITHGWSNRTDQPCLLIGVSVDAEPVY
jgi:mannose-6-phosphate isomerase-like protein (cupin superfamily)